MSRQFTYEIDERNLRMKLRDLEAPFSEGAWERFEAYAATQNKRAADNGLSSMKFSLNRNVIMLAVFAIVIVSFSLLLFNFITIKNPKKEGTASLDEAKAAPAPKVIEAKPVAPAVVKAAPAPTVAAVKDTVAAKPVVPEAKPALPKPAPVEEKAAAPVKEKAREKAAQKSSDDEEADLAAAEKKAEALRIKNEKRAAAALAKKIRPAVITEDSDPDVKPQ